MKDKPCLTQPARVSVQLRKYKYLLKLSKISEEDLNRHFDKIDFMMDFLEEGDQVKHIFDKFIYNIVSIDDIENGIVTLEDVIEHIYGININDEDDYDNEKKQLNDICY